MFSRVPYDIVAAKLPLIHYLSEDNLGENGQDVKFIVQRLDTNDFFDFSDNTFKAEGSITPFTDAEGTLTQPSITNLPGIYSADFDANASLPTTTEYLVKIFVKSGTFKFEAYVNFFAQSNALTAEDVWKFLLNDLSEFPDYDPVNEPVKSHRAGVYLRTTRQGVTNEDTTRELDNGDRIIKDDSGGTLVRFKVKDGEDNVISSYPVGVPTQRTDPTFS